MKPTKPYDELWGTFAVNDHKRKRALVAEVILFARLVVPEVGVRPTGSYWAVRASRSTCGPAISTTPFPC
jgi:hypothetical protein